MFVRMSQSVGFIGVGMLILVAVIFLHPSRGVAQQEAVIHIRWLLSHQPTDVFANAVRVFSRELSQDSGGRMQLEVVMPQDVGVKTGDIPNDTVFRLLNSGDVQLATAYTVALGKTDPQLWALNLPFAFGSYSDVSSFLDGQNGEQLLSSISGARGLAFTMSGGFRIILTKDKKISSPEDLRGLHIATSGGPVAEATLRSLGATPVPLDLESGNKVIDTNTIDGVETTYSRLSEVLGTDSPYLSYVNETDHSVFLTAILANEQFVDSLSPADRTVLFSAARDAADVERKDSEALGESVRSRLAAKGSVITTLTAAERDSFKRISAPVYTQFQSTFGSTVIREFQNVH